MAYASLTASLRSRCILFCCMLLLGSVPYSVCYTPEIIRVKCRDTVDLYGNQLDSGLIYSELPDKIPIYPHEDQRCDIFLSFNEGSEMMFYFDDLDLYSSDRSRCDSTNIQFFDGSGNTPVKGLEKSICGKQEEMPTGVYYALHGLLIIRANSKGVVQGTGFKIHFTIYRRGFPCNRDEFSCEDYDAHSGSQGGFRRCVDQKLVCDDWNDCGDWTDERQNCYDLTVGAIAAIVLVALGLVALVVGWIFFCWIRRQREIKRIGEKDASAVMRDTSFTSSRAGGNMMSPFSISNETLEKDRYMPRYAAGRNSARRGQGPTRAPDYQEHPPPYTEKPSLEDESRSSDHLEAEESRPRSRQKRREPDLDEVFQAEGDPPRARRGRSRSQEGRAAPPREDRYPSRDDPPPARRDERDSPRTERYGRDPDDSRPPRNDRYPSRRDDSPPPARRDDRDRPRDRYDDRDRPRDRYDDRDRPRDRYDDRDRPPSRHDPKDKDRDRDRPRQDDRDRDPRRERASSRRGPAEDDEDDMMDQLHPLREVKRRSMHMDSDPDTSREEPRPPRDRSPHDDRHPSRDPGHGRPARDELNPPPNREGRSSPRDSDRDDRPRDREDRPRDRNGRGPSRDRPGPRNDRPDREEPRSQPPPRPRSPDDSYEDVEFRGRPSRQDPDEAAAGSPPRNRRRRSRSREGQDRPRSGRAADDSRGQGRGRGRGGGEEGGKANMSYGGYMEQSV